MWNEQALEAQSLAFVEALFTILKPIAQPQTALYCIADLQLGSQLTDPLISTTCRPTGVVQRWTSCPSCSASSDGTIRKTCFNLPRAFRSIRPSRRKLAIKTSWSWFWCNHGSKVWGRTWPDEDPAMLEHKLAAPRKAGPKVRKTISDEGLAFLLGSC